MSAGLETLDELFRTESAENLQEMERGVAALEANPGDDEVLREVFRHAHTIKGSAQTLGHAPVAELAYVLEELLRRLRDRALPISEGVLATLTGGILGLRELISAGDPAASAAPRKRAVRVDVERLDRMQSVLGKLAAQREDLRAAIDRRDEDAGAHLSSLLRDGDVLQEELERLILETQLLPIRVSFQDCVRIARDRAAASGKLVVVQIEGEDVGVDARTLDLLREPLTHLVGVAVDHGIELPEARIAAGKDPIGLITLSARRNADGVLITLVDDGAKRIDPLDGDVARRNITLLGGSLSARADAGEGATIELLLPRTVAPR